MYIGPRENDDEEYLFFLTSPGSARKKGALHHLLTPHGAPKKIHEKYNAQRAVAIPAAAQRKAKEKQAIERLSD